MTYSPKTAISLSGKDAAVDTVNFALIDEDVLHRKVHQGMLFYEDHAQSGNNNEPIVFAITTFSGINPHLAFQLMGAPAGSAVFLDEHISGSTLINGIQAIRGMPNRALGHSGNPTSQIDVFTSTKLYSSASISGTGITIFQTIISSGQVGAGFGNQANFPLHPYELVLYGGKIYSINVAFIPSLALVNLHVHWYESGA